MALLCIDSERWTIKHGYRDNNGCIFQLYNLIWFSEIYFLRVRSLMSGKIAQIGILIGDFKNNPK